MSQDLYKYYERELSTFNQLAQEFGRRYPKVAGRLMFEQGKSTDPHVERLIQAFALLSGRIHHKLDDEFPELTDALLSVLYPHYLSPIPSCMVAEFQSDPDRNPLISGFHIPRHSVIQTSFEGVPCRYRTTYPVTLWPVRVIGARLLTPPWQGLRMPLGRDLPRGTAGVLHLQLECQGAGLTFEQLSLKSLRFHLTGENQATSELYEAILGQATQVMLVPPDKQDLAPVEMSAEAALHPVGFGCRANATTGEEDESLFPYPPHSFPGYRLLTELFTFPAKFWFFDLMGLQAACRKWGFGKRMDVMIFLKRIPVIPPDAIDVGTFRLGCAPAVNLFPLTAEPIPVTQRRYEYRIVPDVSHPSAYEIHTVEEVEGISEGKPPVEYRPFFAIDHATGFGRDAYWVASRRPTPRDGDRGTDVWISLVDKGWDPQMPANSTLIVRTLCTNRNLPEQLRKAGEQLPLEPEMAIPISRVRCVRAPTIPLRPQGRWDVAHADRKRRGMYWRLISHLSLNHLSLTDPTEGLAALKEILRLYNFSDLAGGNQEFFATENIVEGILSLTSRRVLGRVVDGGAGGFCRGIELTMELDEEKYVGAGAFLFASVMERFMGLYTSINSFTQLRAVSAQDKRVIKLGAKRAGDQTLI